MALLYTTPALTVRHWHHQSELYDANAPTFTHALEVMRFCLDGVYKYFELPQGAKCIRFEVWEGAKPDRVKITQDDLKYFCIESDARQYIKCVARDVLNRLFRGHDVLYVECTYE